MSDASFVRNGARRPSRARFRWPAGARSFCFGSTALAASLAVLAAAAAPALGNSHVFTTTFGAATSTPANAYPLSQPTDVAVDLSSHDVYVTDTANHRVEKFDSSGHLLLMFGKGVNKTQVQAGSVEAQQNVCVPSVDECQAGATSATSSPASLNTPTFVAVDNSGGPSAGDVYVADTLGSGIVSKFEPGGQLIATWNSGGQLIRSNGINGITVSSGGDLVVLSAKYPNKISSYSPGGGPLNEFTVPVSNETEPDGVAVDANGHFYKGGGQNDPPSSLRVTEFTEGGEIADTVTLGPVTGLTTDPLTNDLYADEQGSFVSHFKAQCGEFCTPSESFGSGKLTSAGGISVDAPSDDVYVANTGAGDVAVFDGVAPYTTTEPASPVGRTTATIAGHFSDGGRGAITGCHFEYGATESYEAGALPCEPSGPYGSAADVTAQLTGLQPETTYHYRLVTSNAAGSAEGADRTFTPHFVIQASTEPATNVSDHGGELNASYVGDGHDTKYYFQYGSTESYGQTTPQLDAGAQVGPQTVTPASLTNLQPGTTIHYRFVATNAFGTTYGQDRVFNTLAKPELGPTSSSHVTATAAEIHAQINPRGADTTYHFEYGTTSNYGTSVPSPAQDIGSAYGAQEVSVALTGLEVGATYHFRVVAENVYGRSVSEDQEFGFYPPNCPNATVRQETGSNHLPDCRGYELVSPPDAGGTSLYPEGPTSPVATSPSRFAFGGFLDTIPGTGSPVNVWGDLYVASRGDTGWETKYVGFAGTETNEANGPPGPPESSGNGRFLVAPSGVRTNLSMSKFLDWNDTNYGFASPNPPPNFAPQVWAPDGAFLGEWPTASGHPAGPILNQSPDFSHYYYISGGAVTQRYGEYEEEFTYEGGTAYDNNVNGGTVTPIAFDSDGNPIDVKGVPGSSTDGSRVLMSTSPCQNPAPSSCAPGELYMRINDSATFDIAKGHSVQYVGMTADASKVYFTSADKLTATDTDTSTDLYMWSENTNSLTLVSIGTGGSGNSDTCSASWTEKCGVAVFVNNNFREDFSKGNVFGNGLSDNAIASGNGDIYFYSPEQLDGAEGSPNQQNLYVYRNGAVKYVATLEPGGFCEAEGPCSPGPIVRMQVSPDDSHMAFLTASRVTSYDNAKHTEMYTYSPASEQITCVSCRVDGSSPTSDVWASANGLFMTNDGRTFFSTSDALVRRDTDGLRDVYEYVEGRAQLISSGTSGKDVSLVLFGLNHGLFVAQFVGVSADGTDAYFSTYDTLVPQDRNGGFLKFYDARTGGGFPFVAPPAPCEAADECAGGGSSPPAIPPGTSSASLGGGGNASRSPRRHRRKRSKGRHHVRRGPGGTSGSHRHG